MRGGPSGSKPDTQKQGWLSRAPAAAATPPPSASSSTRRMSRLGLAILLLAVLVGLALWKVPEWQIAPARDRVQAEEQLSPAERLLLDKELFQAENAARSTLALILGAAGLLAGLSIAWRRFEISRELRSHERFASAVEQLASERSDGSARTETRLGGIYALERLANESEREYWPIMEVLTAYVRENAAWKNAERSGSARPGADIQAILAVLGRRKAGPHGERRLLDLRDTDLRATNLSGIRLAGVTMHGAHLEAADLTRASLARSNLREANLASASLTEVDLEGASLSRVNLEGARLNGANLKGADLSGANLRGADLWEANLKGCNLKDVDLRGADLSQSVLEQAIMWRADLSDAVLTGARLRETHLERANLSGVSGLTWEQGEDAFTDETTLLPEYLMPLEAQAAALAAAATVPVRRTSTASAGAGPASGPGARTVRSAAVAAPVDQSPVLTPPAPAPVSSNVVELKPAAAASRARRAAAAAAEERKPPKKVTRPKHRKQDLVKPA